MHRCLSALACSTVYCAPGCVGRSDACLAVSKLLLNVCCRVCSLVWQMVTHETRAGIGRLVGIATGTAAR